MYSLFHIEQCSRCLIQKYEFIIELQLVVKDQLVSVASVPHLNSSHLISSLLFPLLSSFLSSPLSSPLLSSFLSSPLSSPLLSSPLSSPLLFPLLSSFLSSPLLPSF
jgi:hypothetical protein